MKDLKLVTISLLATTLLASNLIVGQQYINDSKDYEKKLKDKSELIKKLQESELSNKKLIQNNQTQLESLNKQLDQLKKDNDELKKQYQAKMEVMNSKRQLNVEATAYTASCSGCSGYTYSGLNVKNTITYEGRRIISADLSVIPLYSIVKIGIPDGTSFEAIVLDKGGGIKGNRIDVLVESYNAAISFGRKNVTVTVLREGKG